MTDVPAHHPADDTLLSHAAGTLPLGRSLVVATHLPFCAHCRTAIRFGEAIGGALLAAAPPSDLAPEGLARALARLEVPTAPMASPPAALPGDVALPDALVGLAHPPWRWLAPGISRISVALPMDALHGQQHVWLLRIAPGMALPDHGHRGWEATCVLAGSFTDISGEYRPGDVAEMNEATVHQPIAGAGEPCVCLIAWEGKLRMRGWLARLAQPLIGV